MILTEKLQILLHKLICAVIVSNNWSLLKFTLPPKLKKMSGNNKKQKCVFRSNAKMHRHVNISKNIYEYLNSDLKVV